MSHPQREQPSALVSIGTSDRRLEPRERSRLERVLDGLAERESEFSDRLYALLFERCPEVRPLFGAHSLSEQEEMLAETFRSIVGWMGDEPWLAENLRALGTSHAEYGVESAMYAPFPEIFRDAACDLLEVSPADEGLDLLREAVSILAERMREAGEALI